MTSQPSLSLLVLRAVDPEAMVRVYELLGCEFCREQHGAGPVHFSADIGGFVLEIYPRSPEQAATSALRLGFFVNGLEEVLAALPRSEVKIGPVSDTEWSRRAVVTDQEGHRIELTERRQTAPKAVRSGTERNLGRIDEGDTFLAGAGVGGIIWMCVMILPNGVSPLGRVGLLEKVAFWGPFGLMIPLAIKLLKKNSLVGALWLWAVSPLISMALNSVILVLAGLVGVIGMSGGYVLYFAVGVSTVVWVLLGALVLIEEKKNSELEAGQGKVLHFADGPVTDLREE